MITLPHLYMLSRRKDKDGRTARSILEAQHFFASLAEFDPRSAEPVPRPMTSLLDDIAKGVDGQTDGLHDRLWRICDHCGQSFASLFRAPNEEPLRVHELMHVRQVRELDVQSFVKLSMRPGFNIRQKLASDPHLNAPRHIMSFDISENRLLKACARRLVALLEAKSAAFSLSTMEEELSSRINLWLHSEAASSISTWTNPPPNNTLLSHRDYRRIWDAWGMLDRIDEEVARDWANHEDIAWGIGFWKRLSALRSTGRTQLAEVPLVFDIAHLTIRPFAGVGIPADNGQNRASDSSPSQGRLILYGEKLPASKRREVKSSPQRPIVSDAVCIDFASQRPWFSTDGKSTSRLRRILAWQRWEEHDRVGAICTGCFHADGVWQLPNTETIVPLDVFFQDCHEVGLLDTAFRDMTKFLKEECFATDTLVWLVPDFLHDLELGTSRRAINATFPKSEPMPRSIAAVIAQIPYERVRPGDSVMVVDCVGGVRFATKLVASHDARLDERVPETHGIVWTCHPSVILYDRRLKRNHASGLHVVDKKGIWRFCRPADTYVDKAILDKAEKVLGRCTTCIFATRQDAPLTCGGFRVHALQQKAGDFAIWRYQLPALSMGSVIVNGMYGDFTLVDTSSQSIRPVRGQAVTITVSPRFDLPRFKAVFPLRQGEGRQALDYVAEVDFPPQGSSTPCRLNLQYTYGADEPYSLDFEPCEKSASLPRLIHAKWRRADQVASIIPPSHSSPSFPEMKSWHELRKYQKKDGPCDLVDQIEQTLTRIDPMEMARREAARREAVRKKRFHEKEEQYRQRRKSGIVSSPVMQKNGPKFFFIEGDGGKFYCCNENALRHSYNLDLIDRGTRVWFAVRDFVDKKTGEQRSCAIDVTLEDILPDDLQLEFESLYTPVQPLVLPIGEFLNRNAESIKKALRFIRFPMLTIMHGARKPSDADFPAICRSQLKDISEMFAKALGSESIPKELKPEVLQFLGYFHRFAPKEFEAWALKESSHPNGLDFSWRKIAYSLGDVSQPWQRAVCKNLVSQLNNPMARPYVLTTFGVAIWRSINFIDFIDNLISIQKILSAIEVELELSIKRDLSYFGQLELITLCMELILAFLRKNPNTLRQYAPSLQPNKRPAAVFVDLIDRVTCHLCTMRKVLPSHVSLSTIKPAALYNTPDLLYAIRCYLTGDDGANAISIVGISEDEGEED